MATIKVIEGPKTYQLTPSEAKAETLQMISARVRGCSDTSRRKHADGFVNVLRRAGVRNVSMSELGSIDLRDYDA